MKTNDLLLIGAALVVLWVLTRKNADSAADATLGSVGASSAGSAVNADLAAANQNLPTWARAAALSAGSSAAGASGPPRVTADATSDKGAAAAAVYFGVPLDEVTDAGVAEYNHLIDQRRKKAGM